MPYPQCFSIFFYSFCFLQLPDFWGEEELSFLFPFFSFPKFWSFTRSHCQKVKKKKPSFVQSDDCVRDEFKLKFCLCVVNLKANLCKTSNIQKTVFISYQFFDFWKDYFPLFPMDGQNFCPKLETKPFPNEQKQRVGC